MNGPLKMATKKANVNKNDKRVSFSKASRQEKEKFNVHSPEELVSEMKIKRKRTLMLTTKPIDHANSDLVEDDVIDSDCSSSVRSTMQKVQSPAFHTINDLGKWLV